MASPPASAGQPPPCHQSGLSPRLAVETDFPSPSASQATVPDNHERVVRFHSPDRQSQGCGSPSLPSPYLTHQGSATGPLCDWRKIGWVKYPVVARDRQFWVGASRPRRPRRARSQLGSALRPRRTEDQCRWNAVHQLVGSLLLSGLGNRHAPTDPAGTWDYFLRQTTYQRQPTLR